MTRKSKPKTESKAKISSNNIAKAVDNALSDIDDFNTKSKTLVPPSKLSIEICNRIAEKPNGTRIACLLFAYYSIEDMDYEFDLLPAGTRGVRGDKKLCTGLKRLKTDWRMTAAFEAVGTKSNVKNIKLTDMPKFSEFLAHIKSLNKSERVKLAEYLSWKASQTIKLDSNIPPLDAKFLTYYKAQDIFYKMISTKSGGYIQQFMVAALLKHHRARYGNIITTHNPNAADKYDGTAGDIEEFRAENLVSAYEVTVRPDWKSRIYDFTDKMERHNLSRYVIIASNIRDDEVWGKPATSIIELNSYSKDIAVIDILDFVNVFLAELNNNEITEVLKTIDTYLKSPKLSNNTKYIKMYHEIVEKWLES